MATETEVYRFVYDFATHEGADHWTAHRFAVWVMDKEHPYRSKLKMGTAWKAWNRHQRLWKKEESSGGEAV